MEAQAHETVGSGEKPGISEEKPGIAAFSHERVDAGEFSVDRGAAEALYVRRPSSEGNRRKKFADASGPESEDTLKATALMQAAGMAKEAISKTEASVVQAAEQVGTQIGTDVSARAEAASSALSYEGAKDAALAPVRVDKALKGMADSSRAKIAKWDLKSARSERRAEAFSDIADALESRRLAKGSGKDASFAERFWLRRADKSRLKAHRLAGTAPDARGALMRFRRKKASGAESFASSARTALAGCAAMLAFVVFGIPLIVILASSIFSVFAHSDTGGAASLTEVERTVVAFFRAKELGDVQIAAIMGNMKAESGMDPSKIESNGVGIGICQWSYGRADSLRAYAQSVGKPWTDLGVQLDFFWDHDEFRNGWAATYRVSGGYANPSPPPGTMVSGAKSRFLVATDVAEATKEFCYGWERPGFPRIDNRIRWAREYYMAIIGGHASGQEYDDASAAQKRVADAACAGNMYGTGGGWCQAWVAYAYAAAGFPFESSCCATSAGDKWIVSPSSTGIPVGATVYGMRSAGHVIDSYCGRDAAHVAIYVGSGNVVSNEGGSAPTMRSLESFNEIWGYRGWGWNGGHDLSAMS